MKIYKKNSHAFIHLASLHNTKDNKRRFAIFHHFRNPYHHQQEFSTLDVIFKGILRLQVQLNVQTERKILHFRSLIFFA